MRNQGQFTASDGVGAIVGEVERTSMGVELNNNHYVELIPSRPRIDFKYSASPKVPPNFL